MFASRTYRVGPAERSQCGGLPFKEAAGDQLRAAFTAELLDALPLGHDSCSRYLPSKMRRFTG